MATTVTIEEAQAHLAELIAKLSPEEEVVITQNQRPVAKLIGQQAAVRKRANREARRVSLSSCLRMMNKISRSTCRERFTKGGY
jgi:prevent-host-death family protein